VGLGGSNEGYDAADYQNMFLALQTVTPRSQARVVHSSSSGPVALDLSDPLVLSDSGSFLRLDLEDVPMPSFHRPDLVNFWNHRMLRFLINSGMSADDAARAIIQPYADDKWNTSTGVSAVNAALISAIKRQMLLRPTREDNPHFDGGNPLSAQQAPTGTLTRPLKDASGQAVLDPVTNKPLSSIAFPIWETAGPWDVDNDNDGVRDSVWVDLGDPIQETEDGRRYKPLYAFLCVDLDSRLNVNAHGLADDLVPPLLDTTKANFFDPTHNVDPAKWPGNLAHNPASGGSFSTLQLPRGLGYGPAEISLRPLFPAPLNTSFNPIYPTAFPFRPNQDENVGPVDSYAALLFGRLNLNGKVINGRYGNDFNLSAVIKAKNASAAPGANYEFDPIVTTGPGTEPAISPRWYTGEQASPSLLAQLKFFDYPWASTQTSALSAPPTYPSTYPPTYAPISAFGTSPDLKGRYAVGVDYNGQPVYEVANDVNPQTALLTPDKWLRFNLLAKSPYEIDLTNQQRRDSWASRTNSTSAMSDPVTAFNTSLGQNDDSAFSATDLEKVLRGWDADSGTLPSRLWDVVNDFDPLKLMDFDPNHIQSVASNAFGSTSQSALLASAQATAGINRRLVTTDSFDLPVANQTMPAYVSEFGADGVPGRRGDSAHSSLNYVENTTLTVDKTNYSDDFQAIMAARDSVLISQGITRAKAKITDLLYYRFWLEARRFVMRTQHLTESGASNSLDALSWADYQKFMALVKLRADYAFARTGADLLAPEVLAGKRMDLNRPFGNGKDDNGDGVVDDPLEAGEPFLDINGNGKMDYNTSGVPIEPFIDMNGNGKYDAPGDILWPELGPTAVGGNGTLAEQITFDYTNGHAEPISVKVQNAMVAALKPVNGGVRNLESQGRQLYARHLYCLMLLLMDENYIAPWDENDPQIATFMVNERNKLINTALKPPLTIQEADLIVKRKLTCRMIAQWAVNCVDMRDADAIMTPFEYDENPWDGWGVWDDKWLGDTTSPPPNFTSTTFDPTLATFIPLDGDPGTNENDGWVIDWSLHTPANLGRPKTLVQLLVNQGSPVSASNPPIITHPLLQTRGLVWGAERPELLITETLAFHDRRTEDLISNDHNGHYEMQHYDNPAPGYYQDPDPDQSLRPRGTLMVEVQNPWSPNGQYPAEVYSKLDSTTGYAPKYDPNPAKRGVEMGRLSNYAWDEENGKLTTDPTKVDATHHVRRSPVWRMVVVEEWPDSRNDDTVDDNRMDRTLVTTGGYKEPKAYVDMATQVHTWTPTADKPNPPFRATDIDFDAAFDAGFMPKQKAGGVNQFEMKYPYIEREFYFTTDKSPEKQRFLPSDLEQIVDYNYSPASFKLRIPFRGVALTYPSNVRPQQVVSAQKFIPWGLEMSSLTDPVIAPIMPGRYGVIGSAGSNYYLTTADPVLEPGQEKDPAKQIYISTVGRKEDGSNWNTSDNAHYPLQTRRIEMRPSKDPAVPQILVGSNGGDPKDEFQPSLAGNTQYDPTTAEIGRDNELINENGNVKNIFDSKPGTDLSLTGTPNSRYYQPPVAIPVEGMNISEPAWGYSLSEAESAVFESNKKVPHTAASLLIFKKEPNLTTKNYEGRYYGVGGTNQSSYDKPFDGYPGHPTAPELLRNGTTANYRTIHLQRLANPMLPWNPAPGTFKDSALATAVDMYRANMPINPYITVDTSSVNLTSFNGVSEAESNYPNSVLPGAQDNLLQKLPWDLTYAAEMIKATSSFTMGKQVWYFRSTERGAWARLNVVGSNPTAPATVTSPPQRVLWAQEPAMVRFLKPQIIGTVREVYDLIPGRQVTMRVDEVPSRIKDSTAQNILKNRVQMVMENTLGFGNKSFGLLYDQQGAKVPGTPNALSTSSSAAPLVGGVPLPSAIGAPAPCDFTWDKNATAPAATANLMRIPVNSTNPWLAWDNRPYVSAEELLKVPVTSQAQMLRQYAAIDSSVAAASRANPYGLASTIAQPDIPPTLGSLEAPAKNESRWAAAQAPFGSLTNVFATTAVQPLGVGVVPMPWYVQGVADVVRDATGAPVLFDKAGAVIPTPGAIAVDAVANVKPYGGPNFNRLLEYVQVPSRYVGTDTMLTAETFNDVPTNVSSTEPVGTDITGPTDPRFNFQPPFNKVSRERDPGRVNLNTVTGRRVPPTSTGAAQIWSEVYDGIMHRFHDGNLVSQNQLGHFGPAWRDVVLSRRGYAQFDAANAPVDKPSAAAPPDTFEMGLNNNFPTVFSNPFRSPDTGDLVPLVQMMQFGVDTTMLRKHPYNRSATDGKWGAIGARPFGDARDAGFGSDQPSYDNIAGARSVTIPADDVTKRDSLPLFSDMRGLQITTPTGSYTIDEPFTDPNRNPYMMYEPMSRLGNLVTNRSGVYAVWITVGYFEVEKAPDWNDPDPTIQTNVRTHFGNDPNLYNRAYPDGYMLGKELGSETGDVKRPRGFYIIDRTEEVGFKPGEDLNVEKTIRLRRRIE
jgi:hypothetical protein